MEPRRNGDVSGLAAKLPAMVVALVSAGALLAALASTPFVIASDAVNLNTATAENLAVALELDIGLADRLVAERDRVGPFRSIHDAGRTLLVPRDRLAQAANALAGLDYNAADAGSLAAAIGVPRSSGARMVADRASRPGGRWSSPDQALATTVLDARWVESSRSRLIVRTPGRALVGVVLWVSVACALLVTALIAQRRFLRAADAWLLPMASWVSGLHLVLSVAGQDPLREAWALWHVVSGYALGLGAFGVSAFLGSRRSETALRGPTARVAGRPTAAAVVLVTGLLITNGGSRIGVPGLAWFLPAFVVWVTAEALRHAGSLGPGRLRPARIGVSGTGAPAPTPWVATAAPTVGAILALLVTRHLGVAVLCAVGGGLLLYAANRRLAAAAVSLGTCLALWPMASLDPRGVAELAGWFSPFSSSLRQAPAQAFALWSIASGGAWGSGLGLGLHPRGPATVLAASVAEDLGAVGFLALALALVAVVWRCCGVALRGHSDQDRLWAAGLATLATAQTLLSIGGATGLLPHTGIPLPFAADSRVLQVLWFAGLGLVCGVSARVGRVAIGVDRAAFRARLAEVACGCCIAGVGVGAVRVGYLQTFAAYRIAAQPLLVRTKHSAPREVWNPRLIAIARSVPRGRILDQRGRILATSSLRDISAALPGDDALARRYYRGGRYYPGGAACAPVVGLWTPREGAMAGIEKEFDAHLRGYRRLGDLLPELRARDLPVFLGRRAPAGGDVVLTINGVLQEDAYRILRACSSGRSAMVVLECAGGRPIVAASLPSLDPNRYVLGSAADRATPIGLLGMPDLTREPLPPPPAPFKVVTALALGTRGESIIVRCSHVAAGLTWADAGRTYASELLTDDALDGPHGEIGLERAVREACSVWFAHAAIQVGPEAMFRGIQRVLGPALTVDRAGFSERFPEIVTGTGGVRVTPTDMAGVMVSLVSGMAPTSPSYELERRSGDKRSALAPARDKRPGRFPTAGTIRRALAAAVAEGPALGTFRDLPVSVAGKSASVVHSDASLPPDAWFVGYAPVRTPVFAVACWIEGGGSGLRKAAPAVRNMLREMTAR